MIEKRILRHQVTSKLRKLACRSECAYFSIHFCRYRHRTLDHTLVFLLRPSHQSDWYMGNKKARIANLNSRSVSHTRSYPYSFVQRSSVHLIIAELFFAASPYFHLLFTVPRRRPKEFDTHDTSATLHSGVQLYSLFFVFAQHRRTPSHVDTVFNRCTIITCENTNRSGLPCWRRKER